MPFIGLGILIVLLVYTIIFLSYVFVIGTIVGLVAYIFAGIRLRWLRWEASRHNNSNSPTSETH